MLLRPQVHPVERLRHSLPHNGDDLFTLLRGLGTANHKNGQTGHTYTLTSKEPTATSDTKSYSISVSVREMRLDTPSRTIPVTGAPWPSRPPIRSREAV